MERAMSESPCNFAWFELMTTDTASAAGFYNSVVGWNTTDVGTPAHPYSTFNVGRTGVAGLMTLPKEAGPNAAWIGYISVPDVDAHVERFVAAGGQLHRGPTDVPGMLRFADARSGGGAAGDVYRRPGDAVEPGTAGAGNCGNHGAG